MKQEFKLIILAMAIVLVMVGVAMAKSKTLVFTQPLPKATHGTLGTNEKLEMMKNAIEELRTKVQTVAWYSNYSGVTPSTYRNYSGIPNAK